MPMTPDSIGCYLQEIARYPRLTAAQEIELGRQVQQRMRLLEIRRTAEEQLEGPLAIEAWAAAADLSIAELQRRLHRGERARQQMLEANLRLVVSVAKKYLNKGLDFQDLIQEGTLSLSRGVEKFDPGKGYKFSTYAYWWIRQGITRGIAEKSRLIRLPVHVNETLCRLRKRQRQLSQELGRNPSVDELATALEMAPEALRTLLSRARSPVSLDLRVGASQESELGDLLEDEGDRPDERLERAHLRRHLDTLMQQLTPIQQQVLTMRYGLDGREPQSLTEIGRHCNFSRERARQIEQQARQILKETQPDLADYLAS